MSRHYNNYRPRCKKFYPTKCRYCSKRVYYCETEEGGKVFFDEIGTGAWLNHYCISEEEELKLNKEIRLDEILENKKIVPVKPYPGDEIEEIKSGYVKSYIDKTNIFDLQFGVRVESRNCKHKFWEESFIKLEIIEPYEGKLYEYIAFKNIDEFDLNLDLGDKIEAELSFNDYVGGFSYWYLEKILIKK